jgi:hypothetical protein
MARPDPALVARLSADWAALLATETPDARAVAARSEHEHASRAAAIAEIEDLRLSLEELAEWLASGGEARLVTRRWNVRDAIAHLASWAWETRIEVERLLRREPFDYVIHFEREGGPVAWNQQEIDARRGRTLAQLFAELDEEHERIIEMLVMAPDEDLHATVELPRTSGEPAAAWRMPLVSVVVMTCWHARLHLRRIEDVLRGGS